MSRRRLLDVLICGLVLSLSGSGILLAVEPSEVTPVDPVTPSAARYTLERAGRELSEVAKRTSLAVVHIESNRARSEETGSGVLMRNPKDGDVVIVTNRHVIAGAPRQSINIKVSGGRVYHPTAILEDPGTDLAVLKVDIVDAVTAEFGDSDQLDIGHFVMAMGSPFGLSQSVTLGIISAKSRRALDLGDSQEILNQDFLQTDAAINPGNSGGPLVDLGGKIVGINTAIASQGGGNEGIGFSIPSNLVRFVVEELLSKGQVRRGYLGVRLDENFDDAAARHYHLDRRRGSRIVQVYRNSPAEAAHLAVDDIILKFNGEEILDENHLINRVSLTPVDSTVPVEVIRAGRRVTIDVRLKERPPRQKQSRVDPLTKPAILPASLEVAPVTDSLAVQAGFKSDSQGLLVLRTGLGDRNGLRLYDIITEAARTPVHSLAEFESIVQNRDAAEPLLLKVLRMENGHTAERLVLWTHR